MSGWAALGAGEDVVEDDLVDALRVHVAGDLVGRTDVDVVLEAARLGDAAVDDVEAGDEPLGQHVVHRRSSSRPSGPLFSMWNCVAVMLPARTAAVKSWP